MCSESGRRHRFRVCGVGRDVTGGTGGLVMSEGQGASAGDPANPSGLKKPHRYSERALIALVIRTQPMQPLRTTALSMTTRPSVPVSPLRDHGSPTLSFNCPLTDDCALIALLQPAREPTSDTG